MSNSKTFKNITIDDVYNKLIDIESIAKRNQLQISIMWGLIVLIFGAIIAHSLGV